MLFSFSFFIGYKCSCCLPKCSRIRSGGNHKHVLAALNRKQNCTWVSYTSPKWCFAHLGFPSYRTSTSRAEKMGLDAFQPI